jgi:hypothetical protein
MLRFSWRLFWRLDSKSLVRFLMLLPSSTIIIRIPLRTWYIRARSVRCSLYFLMTSTVAATVCIAVSTCEALGSLSRIASSPRAEAASEYPSLSWSLASSNRSLITTAEAKKINQMMSFSKNYWSERQDLNLQPLLYLLWMKQYQKIHKSHKIHKVR